MALLFIDSFDHYNSAHILDKWTSNYLPAVIKVGVGRCGSNGMQVGVSGGSIFDLTKGINFGSTTGTVGHAVNFGSYYTLANLNSQVVSFADASANEHLVLDRMSDGSLEVFRRGSPDVSLGATAPDLLRQDVWYFIEFQMTVHASAGTAIVRVNNVEVLNITGGNTVGSGASPALRQVRFRSGANQLRLIDDLYVLDSTGPSPQNTFLGDCRVEYLRPTANGANQAWSLVGAAEHYQAVNDNYTPDDDTTYLTTVTAGATDTEVYANTGLPSGTIFGAQVNLLARKTDSGPRMLSPIVRHGGVDYLGAPQAPSASAYRYLIQTYQTNPATGAAWTIADINDAEFGVKVTE